MSPDTLAHLKKECRVFTSFLVGQDANDYVLNKYVDAHRVLGLSGTSSLFDRLLVRGAGLHPVMVRLADAYARMVTPTAKLRSKLVLLLAILESAPPFCDAVDHVTATSPPVVVGKICGRIVVASISLAAGTAIFLPLQMFCLLIDTRE